jgi:DNA-binding protein H-NS
MDFQTMTLSDLRLHIAQANEALARKTQEEMEAARKKIQEIAANIGCDAAALIDGRRPARKKYGDDDGNTWTGKGKTPTWLQEKLDEGANLEDFLRGPSG